LLRRLLELTPSYRAAGEDSFGTRELRTLFEAARFRHVVWRRLNLFPNFTPQPVFRLLRPFEPAIEALPGLRALCTVNMYGFNVASSDDSPRIVADYIASNPDERIVLRVNRVNKGLAQNYLDAAFLGRGKYYRLICGDNAEPRDSIVAVFNAIGKADIIVPYFASAEGKSLRRRMISTSYTWLLNLITGNRLQYYNGLAVHLRHNVMRWHPNTHGFGFQADILCLLLD